MKRWLYLCLGLVMGLCSVQPVWAVPTAELNGMRTWSEGNTTRVVFDLSVDVPYRVFTLDNPYRLIVDFDNTQVKGDIAASARRESLFKNIRWGVREGRHLRLVIDLAQPIAYSQFPMGPAAGHTGSRVVIDLQRGGRPEAASAEQASPDKDVPAQRKQDPIDAIVQQQAANARRQAETPPAPDIASSEQASARQGKGRNIIVVIDPGHGGKDPGAAGPGGVREKDVVLAIARRAKAVFDATPGFEAVLTRTDDTFIPLRGRSLFARKHHADMFVSIHADAARSTTPRGSSVFALSQHGATSETARWLAQTENSADLIGGVGGDLSLDDKDEMLRGVLLDLSMTATVNASLSVGGNVLNKLGAFNHLHKPRVEQAGFVVLKSPDIPSLLVETGFISTPAEARLLQDPGHQQKLATAIAGGITRYFKKHPPPGTALSPSSYSARPPASKAPKPTVAPRSSARYRVKPGDTLVSIARANNTSMAALKRVNNLKREQVNVGQVLVLP